MIAKKVVIASAVLIFILFFFLACFCSIFVVPGDFPLNSVVRIEKGVSFGEVASQLKSAGIINYKTPFVVFGKIMGEEGNIKSGDYFFKKPVSSLEVMIRLTSGDFDLKPIRVTVFEGDTIQDISKIFADRFGDFDEGEFLLKTQMKEGYLFPDTYFFSSNSGVDDFISEMENNFGDKMSGLQEQIEESGRDLDEIIIMASLIEKEISDYETRRIVSGLLWKRIDEGMPLQVDAVFPYIIGKHSLELTLDDLKTDSPYNTYTNKGLPPTPICNPGLDAIDAAINPQTNSYWYYLSDKEGNTYFAQTFEEHKRNKIKYLD